MTEMVHDTVRVDLGTRSYDIIVGSHALGEAGRFIKPILKQPKTVVVTDETVAALHLEELTRSLSAEGISVTPVIVPAGEGSKSFETLAKVCDSILGTGIERGSKLIALGGGVVGDLAGFAASVLLRGIDFIQIPTTLLSQVDSSVGGKTGINVPAGKNLVGAFHQPRLVLADTGILDTLPRRELLAGYAEVVKYGAIDDPDFFSWLEVHGPDLLDGDQILRREAVVRSCRAKARIVSMDEKEKGARALLNLGHTFGHALESATGYSSHLLHGEAVAIGMVMAFDLSARLGICPEEDAARLARHLAAVGLPTSPLSVPGVAWGVEDLIGRMGTDKKVADGKLTFILAEGIGKAFITQDVTMDDLRASVLESLSE